MHFQFICHNSLKKDLACSCFRSVNSYSLCFSVFCCAWVSRGCWVTIVTEWVMRVVGVCMHFATGKRTGQPAALGAVFGGGVWGASRWTRRRGWYRRRSASPVWPCGLWRAHSSALREGGKEVRDRTLYMSLRRTMCSEKRNHSFWSLQLPGFFCAICSQSYLTAIANLFQLMTGKKLCLSIN